MALHRLYPLGLECAHCQRWHRLADAIEHAEEFHQDCKWCGIEVGLSRALLTEAVDATEAVRARRQIVRN